MSYCDEFGNRDLHPASHLDTGRSLHTENWRSCGPSAGETPHSAALHASVSKVLIAYRKTTYGEENRYQGSSFCQRR